MLTVAERRRLSRVARAVAVARQRGGGRPWLEVVAGELGGGGVNGLLAGTFNPLTRAHVALAVVGRRWGCARVVLAAAPVSLDKEGVERAHLVDRLDWVVRWARRRAWAVVAVASHPLLVDMAEALRAQAGGEVALLVGADKANQLVEPRWYEDVEAALARLGRAATVLVAERAGHPVAALPLAAEALVTPGWVPARSATGARAVAAAGGSLDGLVPAVVAREVRRTGAYDPDGGGYAERARELDELVAAAGRAG
jgi:nicotinic acid mononucleotide adenylyltransferase